MFSSYRKSRAFAVFQVAAGVATFQVMNGCAQDPAFMETARNISEAERQAYGRTKVDEAPVIPGRGNTEGDGKGNGDVTGEVGPEVVDTWPLPDGTGGEEAEGGGRDTGEEGVKGKGGGDGDFDGKPVAENLVPTATPDPVFVTQPGSPVVVETQQKLGKVDIIWVVDNSGSMSWAQQQLSQKFQSYANKLLQQNVDFQLGVTTTDVCQINWSTGVPIADEICPDKNQITYGGKVDGKMVGPLRGEFVVDSHTGNKILRPGSGFVNSFKRIAKAGTDGSAFEHGLTAAKFAVQKAISGVNTGFLRQDAFLSIIVLSDEEDDGVQMWCEDAWGRTTTKADGSKDLNACRAGGNSPFLDAFGHAPYALVMQNGVPKTQYKFTADNLVSYLNDNAVKGTGKFNVSAITGVRGSNGKIDCNKNNIQGSGPYESGTNYIKAANLTNGVVENICSADWSASLAKLGDNTLELITRIELASGKKPYPGTLEVYVNGVKQGADAYVYDANGNYVNFKTAPEAGSQIRIQYLETVTAQSP